MEREYIIIENGTARQVRETVLRTVTEDKLAHAVMAETQRVETGLLPSGTVAMTKLGSTTALLLWRPARKVSFGLAPELRQELAVIRALATGEDDLPADETPSTVSLALPPQLFGIKMQAAAVVDIFSWFMRDLPIEAASPVLCAPFPNQNEKGKMCAGSVGTSLTGKATNKLGDAVIGHFYASVFNKDMTMRNTPPKWPHGSLAKTLHAWSLIEDATAEDWCHYTTLGALVEMFR